MLALAATLASTGCVDRLIRDSDGFAGGNGGGNQVDTDGLGGTTVSIPDGSTSTVITTIATTDDPDLECRIEQDCDEGQTCFEGVCVGTGTLRISLSWNVVTDLDLNVFVPNGDWMNYENPLTEYGELDVDDCVDGICVNQDGTHVENIFLQGNAPRGTYGIRVTNFDGREAALYSVEVAGAVSAEFSGSVAAEMGAEGQLHQITW